jgi:hypothetical protein
MRGFGSLSVAIASILVLTSCSRLPWDVFGESGELVRDTMAHIIEAVNDQDAPALRAMFTEYALEEYSAEVDEGVARLLALFPNGDLIWHDSGQPAGSGSGAVEYGKTSWRGGMGSVVSSAGKEYTLSFSMFTENTIDPENVGVFRISVDPHTQDQVSGAELASCGSVGRDAREGAPPGVIIGEGSERSHDRAVAIVDALNAQDASAIKGMFTEYARAHYSAEIDAGLEYLLSLFPHGDVTWGDAEGGSAVCERIAGEQRTVLLPTYYTVRSGDVDYRLFFADFIENTIDPENVGIYAIGAALAAECGRCVPEAYLNSWANDFYVGASTRPGVFIHQGDKAEVQMEQIAAALNDQDAAALKGLFSAEALGHTAEIDDGLDYLLSLFPTGGITWTPDPAETNPIRSSSYIDPDSGNLSEWLQANYQVSANGKEFWLYFASVTIDEANPENVGLERLGVTPWIGERSSDGMTGPSADFYDWVYVNVGDTSVDNNRVNYLPR